MEYTYSVTDTANDKVDAGSLTSEIQASSITIALDKIDVTGSVLGIFFKASISTEEETTLDGIVAAHTGEPLPDVQQVHPEVASLQDPHKDVQRVVVQPGRTDHFMCDRDIKINTGMFSDADAIEDLKVNIATNKQEDWNEFSLVGCYKMVDGDYELCDDQDDADINAELTIVDYVAKNQTTLAALNFDFKGGCLWSDDALTNEAEGDIWKHRLYAVFFPNIPASMGGSARFFDGYLYPYQGKWQEAINSLAITVDPSDSRSC